MSLVQIIDSVLEQLNSTSPAFDSLSLSTASKAQASQPRLVAFDLLWLSYIETLAVHMELFTLDTDSTMWFGRGVHDCAAMLSSSTSIGASHETDSRQVSSCSHIYW